MSHFPRRRLLTADAMLASTALASPGLLRLSTRDEAMEGLMTLDQATIDSTGVYLLGQLQRLDPTLNAPLVEFTWSRDVPVRTDASMGDDFLSFQRTNMKGGGGTTPAGKGWVGKRSNAIPAVDVDQELLSNPLHPWAQEANWSVFELAAAMQINRDITGDKITAINLKWNMDNDEQVYIGDAEKGLTGLANNATVTVSNVVNGAGGSPLWAQKTADEQLNDINTVLMNAYIASGQTTIPSRILLPAIQWGKLVTTRLTNTGESGLSYLARNSVATAKNGRPLEIFPSKWLDGAGVGGTNRMVAYTPDPRFIRYPVIPMARLPLQYQGLNQTAIFYGKLGVVEIRYTETIAYVDGI